MRKRVRITVFSADGSTGSSYETTVGPIGFLRIMWDFWRHNGTGLDDWARITALIIEKEENESHEVQVIHQGSQGALPEPVPV